VHRIQRSAEVTLLVKAVRASLAFRLAMRAAVVRGCDRRASDSRYAHDTTMSSISLALSTEWAYHDCYVISFPERCRL
jgi:hypothetical protein